ncbi:Uncharacterized protein dnm_010070 [Desulfonema magnum]|uniref:Uncharacterized protein n=1 Tax=Desulfonema magnum TaxID=45655 RepID=A0A975GLN5_9BACT|nr:Uncharacterized protein dnm_010070 [Desulfonema magnum]
MFRYNSEWLFMKICFLCSDKHDLNCWQSFFDTIIYSVLKKMSS